MSKINIRPLEDKIIVERLNEYVTEKGILIPETTENKSQKGIIVAVGPGKIYLGKRKAMSVKCNDKIIFNKYSGSIIKLQGKDYIVIKEEDVIGILS